MNTNLLIIICVLIGIGLLWRIIGHYLMHRILDVKYPPLDLKMIASQIAALSTNKTSKKIKIQDIMITVPKEWDCRRGVVEQGDCLFYPPHGFYMHWRIFKWKYHESPEQLMNQVKKQAKLRRWNIKSLIIRQYKEIDLVDAVTEAQNGITHRFINFLYNDYEYFCEIKSDTPKLFASGNPIFDACLNTIELCN